VYEEIRLIVTDNGGLKDTTRINHYPEIDLTPSAITVTPPAPTSADAITYSFWLRNLGRMPAPYSRWRLRANGTTIAERDTLVPARDSVQITVAAGSLGTGTYSIRVKADTLSAVVETNETNNASTRSLTVTTAPGGNNPPIAAASGNPTSGDAPLTVTFSSTGSSDPDGDPLTFSWAFGDNTTGSGAGPSHQYTSAGNYTAVLTVSDGRGGTATANVGINVTAPNRSPVAAASGNPTSGIAPLTVQFSSAGSSDPDGDPLTYSWAFGDNTTGSGAGPSHQYTTAGNYTAVLTVSDGRGGTATASVGINVAPNRSPVAAASGNPNSGTAPLTVQFSSAGSSDPDGDPLTYSWAYGDNTTGSGASPSHQYTSSGNYTAVLTVSDGRGGTATANVGITVNPATTFPTTAVLDNFNRANGSVGSNWVDPADGLAGVSIQGKAMQHNCCFEAPVWNPTSFGADQEAFVTLNRIAVGARGHSLMLKIQGNSVANAHLEVRYDDGQKKVFVATFTPGAGWEDRGSPITATFIAADRLGARAQPNGNVLVFKNGSQIGTVSIAGWQYAGSGGRIGLTLDGTVTAKYDNFGGGNATGTPPPANRPPVAAASGNPTSGAAPLTVQFSSTGTSDPDGDPLTYSWAFGDNTNGTGASPSHQYTTGGNYVATLTVSDGRGGTGTANVGINVSGTPPANRPPIAAASGNPTSGTAPLTVQFSSTGSSDPDGDPLTYSWAFGDNTTGTGPSPSHQYTAGGNYVATLTVSDGRGGTGTANVGINVSGTPPANRPPVAAASGNPTSGTAPLTVNFSSTGSSDPDGDPLTFSWAFGDNTSGSGASPSHTYTAAANYTAVLTVSDGRGGSATANVPITVNPVSGGTFPSTAVLDNFNRANGAVGANWVDPAYGLGGVDILSNTLHHACCYQAPVWNPTSFGADQEAFVTITQLAPGEPGHDLMLKIQGNSWNNAHLEVRYDDITKQIKVATYTPAQGGWFDRGAVSATLVSGDQLGARAKADGTVLLYKNGTQVGQVSASSWTYANAGGRIGLTLDGTTGAQFDNFGGGTTVVSAPAMVLGPEAQPAFYDRVELPTTLSISGAYPNPGHSQVSFAVGLPENAKVDLAIYDLQGRVIWNEQRDQSAGRFNLVWQGTTHRGPAPTGIYLARIAVNGRAYMRRFALMR
jgi:PKD repeat protein